MASKRKHSKVWNFFDSVDEKSAKCKYCKTVLSVAGGSQGNLSRHLKNKHPAALEETKRQTNESRQEANTPQIIGPQQQVITSFIQRPPAAGKAEKIDRQLVRMIAKGHHALRIVEEPDFKQLIDDVSNCPGYKMPTRKTLSNVLLPKLRDEIVGSVKEKMELASAVCLTTDCWTSLANESYIAVTAHFIESEATVMSSHMIACEAFVEQHSGQNLCAFLQKIAERWSIENKISAVVSDNAANIVNAIKTGNWPHIPCFAHSLNLIVQKGLREISVVQNKVKFIVEFFNRSTFGLKKVKSTQTQLNLPDLKLIQDVSTRWNSTFKMLERLVVLKDALILTLSTLRSELNLSQNEWAIVEELLPILKPFMEVTEEISAEKNVTLSKVIVLAILLQNCLNNKTPKDKCVAALVAVLKAEMNRRFCKLESNELYAESNILDPRFKGRWFKSKEEYEKAVCNLKRKVTPIRLNSENYEFESPAFKTNSANQSSVWCDFDSEFKNTTKAANTTGSAEKEMEKYLEEEFIPRTADPLVWWEQRKKLYPHLYSYSLKRLCLMATSVPCEHLFSSAGEIIRKRRMLLKPNKVENLMFLHSNM
ncbi:zinc finger BED domain-containing protein 1-like [Drosophila mauritiana]|uniref:Zinc finger BED domain-containing protein 1-like n=1 Tax=Drosophila mauritiana TaxID=7226 RepID=A0A6P8LGH3_DROMA|nr:zinc finger BED domain-containing protein 1-like [Drosophila mauritiana]